MSALIKEITATEFAEVTQADGLVLIDFWAPWCNPCRALSPILDSLADEFRDKVAVYKVNVDDASDLANSLGIRSIPALFLYKDKEVKQSFSGLTSRDKLKSAIETALV